MTTFCEKSGEGGRHQDKSQRNGMEVEWLQDEPMLEYGPIEMVHFMSLFGGSGSVNLLDGCGLEK